MDQECCWNRDVIEQADCPNVGDGEEGLLVSKQQRNLDKCCECPRFLHAMQQLHVDANPLAPV